MSTGTLTRPTPKQSFTGEARVFDDDHDHGRRAAEVAVGRAFRHAEAYHQGSPWTVTGIAVTRAPGTVDGTAPQAYTATLTTRAGDQ